MDERAAEKRSAADGMRFAVHGTWLADEPLNLE
jgi:hypothetical protein